MSDLKKPPEGRRTPSRKQRRLFGAAAAALGVVLFALGLEGGVRGLVAAGWLNTPAPPAEGESFWDGEREVLGVWHHPDAVATHVTDCFSVTYRTNSVGARDRERTPEAAGQRVVVLGDSFVEGWGLPAEERLSDRLEASTGIEHLNFGMSHFGPYQHGLAYREIASRFEHQGVLVGLVPYNDFFDLDLERARKAPGYEYRYRPYLDGTYPDYAHVDFRENRLARMLRKNSFAYNAIAHAVRALKGGDGLGEGPHSRDPAGLFHSYFYDYDARQLDLLRSALERIVAAAGERPVAFFLIPVQRDFLRFQQSGESPLYRDLRRIFAEEDRVKIVDLLAYMHGYTPHWDRYFFTCDYHWDAYGNEVAARILGHQLREHLYLP